jgi:hypothetical protein
VNVADALGIAVFTLALAACGPVGEPTQLTVPNGATDVRQVRFSEGHAHQTDFTLKVPYPDDRALEHYMKIIGEPWIRCDWAPNWDSHLDGTMTPVHTVHQQLHMWVNRDAQRALMLSMRYYSASDCAPRPLNDDQKVVVVEYLGVNVDDQIRSLQLKCPASQVRSNSTPHSDAREAPQSAKSCGARAGGRGR